MLKKVLMTGVVLALLLVVPAMATVAEEGSTPTAPDTSATEITGEPLLNTFAMTNEMGISSYEVMGSSTCGLADVQADLPISATLQVTFNYGLPSNQPYFFQDYISGTGTSLDTGAYGTPGATPLPGWCMNAVDTIYPVNQFGTSYSYTADVCSSYDTACIAAANCYSNDDPCTHKYINFPENLPKVNFILNNYKVGGSSACGGSYTFGDIQYAMWKLVYGTVPSNELWALGSYSTCRVDEIVAAADTPTGAHFVPECGDIVAVVFFPYGPTSAPQAVIAQAVIGEKGFSCCCPCTDDNPCTDETCNELTGCSSTPNTAPCDDGDACTTGDVCSAGSCSGTEITCETPGICEEGGSGFCDDGMCSYTDSPRNTPCDGGLCDGSGVCWEDPGYCSYTKGYWGSKLTAIPGGALVIGDTTMASSAYDRWDNLAKLKSFLKDGGTSSGIIGGPFTNPASSKPTVKNGVITKSPGGDFATQVAALTLNVQLTGYGAAPYDGGDTTVADVLADANYALSHGDTSYFILTRSLNEAFDNCKPSGNDAYWCIVDESFCPAD